MKFWILLLCAAVFSSEKENKLEPKETQNADKYIYVVRHADREKGNGCDVPLTTTGECNGEWQSRQIAEYLFGLGVNQPSVIYTSPLKRTIQTAAPAAKLLQIPLKIDAALRQPRTKKHLEESVCPTGETLTELLGKYQACKDNTYQPTDTNVVELNSVVYDKAEEITTRMWKFLNDNEIIENPTENVAIFAHSDNVLYIIAMLVPSMFDANFDIIIPVGSIAVLKKDSGSDQWNLRVEMGNWTNEKMNPRFFKEYLDKERARGLTDKDLKGARNYLKEE